MCETRVTSKAKVALNYVNPDASLVDPPTYPGHHYQASVPATLDLAERAAPCVNAVTETTDPDYDDELYWIIDLLGQEPAMYHTVDDHVQTKSLQALPLVRTICGSRKNLEVEARLPFVVRQRTDHGAHVRRRAVACRFPALRHTTRLGVQS